MPPRKPCSSCSFYGPPRTLWGHFRYSVNFISIYGYAIWLQMVQHLLSVSFRNEWLSKQHTQKQSNYSCVIIILDPVSVHFKNKLPILNQVK